MDLKFIESNVFRIFPYAFHNLPFHNLEKGKRAKKKGEFFFFFFMEVFLFVFWGTEGIIFFFGFVRG